MTTGQVAEAAQKKQGEQNVDSANTVDFVKAITKIVACKLLFCPH